MTAPAGKPGDGKDVRRPVDPPVIPDRSTDDSDEGWERADDSRELDEDERYLRDRPPHW